MKKEIKFIKYNVFIIYYKVYTSGEYFYSDLEEMLRKMLRNNIFRFRDFEIEDIIKITKEEIENFKENKIVKTIERENSEDIELLIEEEIEEIEEESIDDSNDSFGDDFDGFGDDI